MLLITCLAVQVSAEETQQTRHIAVHDRLLQFEQGEVQMKNGSMIVLLEKMVNELHAQIKYAKDGTSFTITKNNQRITYDIENKNTTLNGVQLQKNPIHYIDEKLYI